MIGLGVMIQRLGGNKESAEVFSAAIGKSIVELQLGVDDALHFTFEDGSRMKLSDEGQSCCESRYMRTDDKLDDFVGAILLGVEIKEAPSIKDSYGVHEIQFLEIQTDRGVFTMASHNEHSGSYGGFHVVASAE